MAGKNTDSGTEVEDILASIREIIADDEGEEKKPAKKAKAKPKAETPKPKAEKPKKEAKAEAPKKKPKKKAEPVTPKPKKKAEDEAVLVLTEVAPEDDEAVAPKAEPIKEEATSKAEEPEEAPVDLAEEVKKNVLAEAGDLELEGSPEIDAALEDLVRAMLKEMLKDYLDKHMADIVKKVALEEVQKLKKKSD